MSASVAPEHISNKGEPLNHDKKMVSYSRQQAAKFDDITAEEISLFAHPEVKRIVQQDTKEFVSEDELDKRLKGWKRIASKQGETGVNANKVVISLFDLSGQWVMPWAEAGYDVYTFDIQSGQDINDFSVEHLISELDFCDVYAIFAACPCTDFASCGSRHFEGKDADGRTEASKELVFQAIRTIELLRPTIWALENPVGRIERLTGLPKPRLTFHPHHFGEDYTKKTIIWGRFNEELETANRPPTKGSKMHTDYGGKSLATKNARSETPEGFSYSFFAANNYLDMPLERRLSYEYPELEKEVVEAVDQQLSEPEIKDIIEDLYQDEDFEQARIELLNTLNESAGPGL